MMDDEVSEARLLAVLAHYSLPEPRYGEQPLKCPVHGDRVASASVNRGKGLWHCHACGAGGDAVSLVMALDSVDYRQAKGMVDGLVGGSMPQQRALQGARRSSQTRWIPPRLRQGA
jgi:phage/plasmid primase-like uncharacterized protein